MSGPCKQRHLTVFKNRCENSNFNEVVSVFTLIRTDTTLDLSQKAEKVCHIWVWNYAYCFIKTHTFEHFSCQNVVVPWYEGPWLWQLEMIRFIPKSALCIGIISRWGIVWAVNFCPNSWARHQPCSHVTILMSVTWNEPLFWNEDMNKWESLCDRRCLRAQMRCRQSKRKKIHAPARFLSCWHIWLKGIKNRTQCERIRSHVICNLNLNSKRSFE